MKVVTGMALGWDQAVARAALHQGIPFTAAIPFEGQDRLWPADARERYSTLLLSAAEVVVVTNGSLRISKAMQLRNEWMVDHSDRLIALWDGTGGGTANCVFYAQDRRHPITHIWDRYATNLPADLWHLLQ